MSSTNPIGANPNEPAEPRSHDEYVERWNARLREWRAQIDGLKSKVIGTTAGGRPENRESVMEAEKRYDAWRGNVDRLRGAALEGGKDLAAGCERAWDDFREAFQRASARLR